MDVQTKGIVKRFGTVLANDSVDITIKPREVHCLLGENGAGKTTLVNVIYGVYEPDAGEILLDGRAVTFRSPKDAIERGIGMISQHFNLVPRLTVTENVVMGRVPVRGPFGLFSDARKAREEVLDLMSATGLQADPDELVAELSVGQQQRVEILKALYLGAEVLILDEPTAALSPQEIVDLFGIIRSMVEQGKAVLIITHKLDEAMKCDQATVMTRGKVCFRSSIKTLASADILRNAMFGTEEIATNVAASVVKPIARGNGQVFLTVSDLMAAGPTRANSVNNVSFEVKAGEIYGIAGVAGNGQTVLFECLVGLQKPSHGRVQYKGIDITTMPPRGRRELGIHCVPEDRFGFGVISEMSVWENSILGCEDNQRYSRRKLLDKKAIMKSVAEMIEEFEIRTRDAKAKVGTLSGGNTQKLILARELGEGLELLVAAQPTRGLDVRTAEFVWERLISESEAGKAIVVISYDLDEILALADRIGVMFEGRLREYDRGSVDIETIGWAMTSGGTGSGEVSIVSTTTPPSGAE